MYHKCLLTPLKSRVRKGPIQTRSALLLLVFGSVFLETDEVWWDLVLFGMFETCISCFAYRPWTEYLVLVWISLSVWPCSIYLLSDAVHIHYTLWAGSRKALKAVRYSMHWTQAVIYSFPVSAQLGESLRKDSQITAVYNEAQGNSYLNDEVACCSLYNIDETRYPRKLIVIRPL